MTVSYFLVFLLVLVVAFIVSYFFRDTIKRILGGVEFVNPSVNLLKFSSKEIDDLLQSEKDYLSKLANELKKKYKQDLVIDANISPITKGAHKNVTDFEGTRRALKAKIKNAYEKITPGWFDVHWNDLHKHLNPIHRDNFADECKDLVGLGLSDLKTELGKLGLGNETPENFFDKLESQIGMHMDGLQKAGTVDANQRFADAKKIMAEKSISILITKLEELYKTIKEKSYSKSVEKITKFLDQINMIDIDKQKSSSISSIEKIKDELKKLEGRYLQNIDEAIKGINELAKKAEFTYQEAIKDAKITKLDDAEKKITQVIQYLDQIKALGNSVSDLVSRAELDIATERSLDSSSGDYVFDSQEIISDTKFEEMVSQGKEDEIESKFFKNLVDNDVPKKEIEKIIQKRKEKLHRKEQLQQPI